MKNLKDLVQAERIQSMRNKDKKRNEILTAILSEIKQYEIDNRKLNEDSTFIVPEITNEIILAILNKMVKSKEGFMHYCRSEKRQDLLDKEEYQLTVIYEFLPKQYSEEEIVTIIQDILSTSESKSMNTLMPILKKIFDGKASMKFVNEKLKILLN
jgi:uncharacterized protein YqeY